MHYVDANTKNRTDLSNGSYFGAQMSLPKTLKMHLDQNRNGSKHPAAMLRSKSKFTENERPDNNFP